MHEKIQVTEEESHMAKKIYKRVEEIMSDKFDTEIDLIGHLTREWTPDGTGINLDMSELVDDMIRKGQFPFTLKPHLEGHFGDSTGSANVTSVRLEEDLNLSETIHILKRAGQLHEALDIIREVREEDDPEPLIILTYAIAQYAKGWLAEEFIVQTLEAWKKGSVSQDEGGIDFHFDLDMIQVGSITRRNSHKKKMEASEIRHILYQWDDKGNIHIADMNEILDVNKEIVSDAPVEHSLTYRASDELAICKKGGTEENPKYFRYVFW